MGSRELKRGRRAAAGIALLVTFACAACENTPSGPNALLHFSDVGIGPQHGCAITLDAKAYCWGSAALGELGVSGIQEARTPVAVPVSERFRKISAGYSHTCALTVGNSVYCWGWGILGQLGNGNNGTSGPVLVLGGHAFSSVSSGWYHTCSVAEAGAVYCWGSNNQGQLGDGTTNDNALPVRVKLSVPASMVSAGPDHTCGVGVDALGYCWGGNAHGELGNTSLEREGIPGTRAPGPVYGARLYATLEAGYHSTCGVQLTVGLGYCWGSGADGKLGTGFVSDAATPQGLAGPSGPNSTEYYVQIVPGGLRYTCGVTTASAVFCWGRGDEGELGRTSISMSVLPIRLGGT